MPGSKTTKPREARGRMPLAHGALRLPALWSLATEVQIYALFALAFVPVWRRFGIGVAVVLAWIAGVGRVLAFPEIRDAAPLFLGLFALGMLAAQVRLRPESLPKLSRAPWKEIAVALWFFFFCLVVPVQATGMNTQLNRCVEGWILEGMVGLATMASLLAGCDGAKFLERPALQKLGAISFSLYLSHAPLLAALGGATLKLGLGPWPTALTMIFGGVPLCLGFAALFWRFIEAPSQRWAAQSGGSRTVRDRPECVSTVPSAPAGAGR